MFLLFFSSLKHTKMFSHKKVSIITFATYVMSDETHVLTPTRAFVCLTLFDMIRMPLALLPLLIVYMIEVKAFFGHFKSGAGTSCCHFLSVDFETLCTY
jgi:hypothetical protein